MPTTTSPVAAGRSRREALRMGFGAALAAGLWPGAARAADPAGQPADGAAAGGDFCFLAVNDLHCMDEASGRWLADRVVPRMKATKDPVAFCLILGDLAEKGKKAEIGWARDAFKGWDVPLHVVPGNHDYVTDADRSAYDELFPKSLNYTFEHAGWQFVGLDTTAGTKYQNIAVGADTLAWADAEVPKLDRRKPTVVFTHFPLGEKVTYRPTNADAVLGRFAGHNLRAVLGGHFHGRTERAYQSAVVTTNACCALKRANHDKTPQKGYHLWRAKDGALTREFVEVPTTP